MAFRSPHAASVRSGNRHYSCYLDRPLNESPTIFIVAGEASADHYGAGLVHAFRRQTPNAHFVGVGGDAMAKGGTEILYHIRDTAVMGFVEVFKRYPFFRRMFRACVEVLKTRKPAAVVLIDYPGFNLRLAKVARSLGIPVLYYISPQVWAWGKNRAAKMKNLVDHIAVVFPFEEAIYRNLGIPVTFVGHPLLEILGSVPREEFLKKHELPDKPVLALLPGSREQEIRRILPVMLEATELLNTRHEFTPVIGAASLPDSAYASYLAAYPNVRLLRNATHAIMEHAFAAMVTSGTATVETACYRTPMAIVYRTSRLNYEIGKRLINVATIGMANILAGKKIVPELVQQDLTTERLAEEIGKYFDDPALREATVGELGKVRAAMGEHGAAERVAEILGKLVMSDER